MKEPTIYYPFSPNDEDHLIMPHVLTGLVSYLTRRRHELPAKVTDLSTAEEILKIIHPYNLISIEHRKRLTVKINKMIGLALNNDRRLKEQILKIETGEYSTVTLQSLNEACEEMISKFRKQKRVDDF